MTLPPDAVIVSIGSQSVTGPWPATRYVQYQSARDGVVLTEASSLARSKRNRLKKLAQPRRRYATPADAERARLARIKAEREARKAAGGCPMCRTPVSGRYVYCPDCRRQRMAAWTRWYRKQQKGRAA